MAVYTKISHPELENLISNYGIGKLKSFTAITEGIQNSNYFVTTDIAKYVLTIYENGINPEDLPFFLSVMKHFAKHGVPCPAIVTDKYGNNINKIQGKHCSITSFLDGKGPEIIETWHIEELGANIAKMHLASCDSPLYRKNELSVDGWIDIFNSVKPRAEELKAGLTYEIETVLGFLAKNWPSGLPGGVIHADMFPDNVFFNNGKLAGIIDFYFACNDAFTYDLAICLNSWCFEKDHNFNETKAKHLLSSYNKVRKLDQKELASLPIMCVGSSMRFFLTRLHAWLHRNNDAIVHVKDPNEYLYKMLFHLNIKSYEEYGFEIHDYNKI